MQLNFSWKKQLQNPKFTIVKVQQITPLKPTRKQNDQRRNKQHGKVEDMGVTSQTREETPKENP
jgi:hypothetical protein